MKVSTAALSFLILAAALGSLAHGAQTHGFQGYEIQSQGVHRPADCCFSYTPRKIRCKLMDSYFFTSGGCHMPAVILITKTQQRVCANPTDIGIQRCLKILTEKEASGWGSPFSLA